MILIFGMGTVNAQYCQPVYSTGCGYGDGLIAFRLNTISQALECSWNRGYYEDYSIQSTDLEVGVPYPISVQSGYSGVNVSVWIDMNDDFIFDSTEILIRNFECTFDSTLYTDVITVPEGTKEGYHRLRFRTSWMTHVPEPCDTLTYGNAADFSVFILPTSAGLSGNSASDFNIYPNPAADAAVIEQKEEGIAVIELIDLSGKAVQTITSERKNITVDVTTVSPGMYFLKYQKGTKTTFTRFSVVR
jgi:hypothetical protein